MSLRLVTAEMRLSTTIARTTLCVLGPSGSGKTSLMKALPGQDTNKLANDAGRIYDTLRPNQGPAAPAASTSNTSATPTVDPQIRSLLGLP